LDRITATNRVLFEQTIIVISIYISLKTNNGKT